MDHLLGSILIAEREFFERGSVARNKRRMKRCSPVGCEFGRDGPVFLRCKGLAFPFSFHDEAHCDGLYASCRETPSDFLPEERREIVADESVEHPARLLSCDARHCDLTRMRQSFPDRPFGNLMEYNTFDFRVSSFGLRISEAQGLGEVPGDGFAFAVFIGSENDAVRLCCSAAKLIHSFADPCGNNVLGSKIFFEVNPKF